MPLAFLKNTFKKALGWLMPDPPKQLPPGAELTSAETDASISKIYGKVQKKGGHIVFKETNDVDNDDFPNDLLHIIIVWSHEVESIDEVYIDDIPYSSNDSAFYSGNKRAVNVVNFPNGMTGYYDPILAQAGWRSTDNLEGMACTYIRLEYHDDETAILSEPNVTADLTGTTHSNPATALRDYLTNALYGKGLPLSYINEASIAYGEALCDSQVPEKVGSGATRPLFTCNVALETDNTVLDNVNTLLKPMRGWLPIINGQLTLIIEEDKAPVAVPILEEDIIKIGKITEGNKNNRFNRVSVTYRDPDADGSKQEAVYPDKDSPEFAAMLAEDNGILREENVELKTCRNYYEALEFAKTYLEVSRQQMRTTITLPLWATIYDVGDIVPVTYMSGVPFWNAKLFIMESKEESSEDVTLSVREFQPYIYDFYGEGNKPELPDTSYVNQDPDAPTDLNIEHIYSNFVQVKASWVSNLQRFDYRVLKGDVIIASERVATNEVELSGFDMGEYRFQVRALGGLGRQSGWSEIPLNMQVPSPPTSVEVRTDNFNIEVLPWLENADSSIAFQYSITDIDATEPSATIRGPSHTYTFSVAPNTTYKIWVRSHNPLGVSEWVTIEATSTNNSAPLTELVQPIIAPLVVDIADLTSDLEDLDSRFVNFSAETLDILKAEKLTREEGEALLLKSISENAAYQIELARKIEEGEELTNALIYRDAATGTIVNHAFQFTEEKFTEAGLKIDGVQGEVNAAVKRIENTEDSVTNLSSELALLPGVITARATAIVSESIAALEPAHAFNFFDSAQGWQAVNGTLSAGVNEITVTHGDIENNTLSFDASDNKLIRVSLSRTAGTGWTGTVIIERDDNSIETYANYVEESALLLIDFTAMANYTGTITRVRLVLGESAADEFTITSITIGKADATTQDLANITARVHSAELQIDANAAEIAQRVTTSYFDNNAITVSNVEQTINALDVIIALEAKRQELIDNDVVQKSVSAAQFINGQAGTIQQIVSAFEQDLANVNGEISDVRQQIDGLGITQQAAALASQQIESYEAQAARLQLAVNDLDAFLKEADKNEAFALAINQLQIDVSPEGSIAKNIEALQSATVSNGESITATNERLSQVETNADGNATAIEQLDLSVTGLGNSLTSAIARIDTVETTANNTATALSATQAKVNDPSSGNEALFNFAQQIKITADAAKDSANVANTAITQLNNTVNNPTSGLSATNTIAQQAKTTAESADSKANANASAITSVNSTAQNANNKAQSALNLASTIDGELEEYRAIAQLAVDANGNAAFIQLGATPEISELIFQSMRVIFQNSQGVPRIFFDTAADDYVFNGLLRSTASEELGANHMVLSDPSGFGPDNLVYYRGPKFLSGSKPDYTKATKANAIQWHDINGDSYFGGSLSAGVLSNAGTSTLVSLNPSLDVGPFNTNGNPKVIAFSFKLRTDSTVDGACPTTSTTPSCTLKLQRKIGSGSWSTLQTKTLSGTVTKNYNAELEKCLIYEESEGSWTFTDTSTSTSTFSYRLVISDQVRFHLTEDVGFQELSLISVEE